MTDVTGVEQTENWHEAQTRDQWFAASAADLLAAALEAEYPDAKDLTFEPYRDANGAYDFRLRPDVRDQDKVRKLDALWEQWKNGLNSQWAKDPRNKEGLTFHQWVIEHAAGPESDHYLNKGRQELDREVRGPLGDYPYVRNIQIRNFLELANPISISLQAV